jgi:hypothetical protein
LKPMIACANKECGYKRSAESPAETPAESQIVSVGPSHDRAAAG